MEDLEGGGHSQAPHADSEVEKGQSVLSPQAAASDWDSDSNRRVASSLQP